MNVPTDIAKQVVDGLRGGGPFLMALVAINIVALAGFGYVLHEIANSMQARVSLIEKCIDK